MFESTVGARPGAVRALGSERLPALPREEQMRARACTSLSDRGCCVFLKNKFKNKKKIKKTLVGPELPESQPRQSCAQGMGLWVSGWGCQPCCRACLPHMPAAHRRSAAGLQPCERATRRCAGKDSEALGRLTEDDLRFLFA